MSTIGWAILAVGLLFNTDMARTLKGDMRSDGASGFQGALCLGCILMMAVSTFR